MSEEKKAVALDWDYAPTTDGSNGGFEPLPEGDYVFTIKKCEKSRYKGSAKTPPCPMAKITLECTDGQRTGLVFYDLPLASNWSNFVSEFFRGVGWKKRGYEGKPDWDHAEGIKGECHIIIDEWIGQDGTTKRKNKVKEFYDQKEIFRAKVPVTIEVEDAEEANLPF